MSRIKEKIKDLIEVHPYKSLQDFSAEPAETLSGYHFTGITSNLMVNWLDALVNNNSRDGLAKALAGYRGVGKSHFLATFGAILANPELRSKISDPHVGASAEHLKRKRFPVAFVRRGTQAALLDEIKFGISNSLGIEESEIPNDLESIIQTVAKKSVETPFVIIVDTALERESRVVRDDGGMLGDLAEIAKRYNVFIGVALDDDITNADGINSSIARNFTIDYLDQEHLYQIVNKYIFPKHRQTQELIRRIYADYRSIFDGFRWSEQRFNALYPLHPSILEVAPFIRLYVQDFAVLGFASEAGTKILGRPANSLIALDELFDSVENSLRKSPDLQEVFETYDKINREIISQIPVMQRLQAKLILKAWFILSLDGDGTTAAEVAAAMLIFDEREPQKSAENVTDLLETITAAFPNEIWRKTSENGEDRFSFKLSKKDSFNEKLDKLVETVADDEIPALLHRVAKDKFSDWHFSVENDVNDVEEVNFTDCRITWRGGVRRARFWWNWDNEISSTDENDSNPNIFDIEIIIKGFNENNNDYNDENISQAVWQIAELTSEENAAVKKLCVLSKDESLREDNLQQVNTAIHTGLLAAEKIWNRVFLKDAKLKIGGVEISFPVEAGEMQSLGEVFSLSLKPYFEKIFPNHPTFSKPLTMDDVSKLVNDLFSGAKVNNENVQELAETFALPLSLVSKRGENYLLETEEEFFKLPLVETILSIVEQSPNRKISLETVHQYLQESPYGLVREIQNLILGALVAQRKIEFVTSKGDRISRRSLDLKILWGDIDGIAKCSSVRFDREKIIKWTKLLTNNQTIDFVNDEQILQGLKNWLESWEELDILTRFNQLPDEILNTKVWQYSVNTEKTFGTAADSISLISNKTLSIEEGIQRIIDSFFDSEKEFQRHSKELIILRHFIEGADLRQMIWAYLAVCESTPDEEIEALRERLFYLIGRGAASPNAEENVEIRLTWENFHTKYSDFFAAKHDTVMKSHFLQEKFDEIIKSDQFWEFENLSKLPIFQTHFRRKTDKILRQFAEFDCSFDVRENLKSHPFCACSFNLAKINEWESLPKTLFSTIEAGRKSYRRTLLMLSKVLVEKLESFARNTDNQEFVVAAADLIEMFEMKKAIPFLSMNQIIILGDVLENIDSSTLLEVEVPKIDGLQNSNEIRERFDFWLGELPEQPVLLKI